MNQSIKIKIIREGSTYRWVLYAANGKPIACSYVSYKKKSAVIMGAKNFKWAMHQEPKIFDWGIDGMEISCAW